MLLLASFVAVGCKTDDDEPTKYTVTVATDIANGTLSVSTTSAEAGTTIRLTATPDDGYEFDSYTVTDSVGNTITVTGGTFTMPESNVTVSATFKEITYTVTLTGGANATVSGGATTQSDLNGAMTTVTYTASNGYYFADFTATTTNGITLTRTSSSVVTVSGTPTTDTSITVPDAAQIVPLTAITLNKTSTTISAGSTEPLSVSAYEPGNATFQTVTWSSDNTDVATVDTTGLVTAVAAGENGTNASATITATATDGSGITATCTVTVTPLSVDVDNRGFTASSWENGIGDNLTTE